MEKDTRVDPDVYREFIKGIDIDDIRLISINAKITNVNYMPSEGIDVDINETGTYKNVKTAGFTAKHTYKIKVASKDQKPEKPYISFNAVFEVKYRTEKKMTKKIWDLFKKVNLPLNTRPYARELFNNTLTRFNHPPLTLPAFKAIG